MAGHRFLSCLISSLLVTYAASAEYVSVHTLQESSNSCSLPKRLDVIIERQEKDDITFALTKNSIIKVSSGVVLLKADSITGETIFEHMEIPRENEAFYNTEKEACIVAHCSKNRQSNTTVYILEGTLFHDSVKYKLSPQRQEDKTVTYVMEEVKEFNKPTDHGSIRVPEQARSRLLQPKQDGNRGTERKRRRKRSVTDYYIDILPIIDFSLFSRWYAKYEYDLIPTLNAMNRYFTNVFTGISLRYDTLDLHDNVVLNIRMTEPFISMDNSTSPFTENNKLPLDSGGYFVNIHDQIHDLRNWIWDHKDNLTYNDHTMLFSGYDWYSDSIDSDQYYKGIAYIGSACSQEGFSSSVIQDLMGFQSEGVAAHELGHSLEAGHDGDDDDCDSNDLYVMAGTIMNPSPQNMMNNFKFSSCSSQVISEYIQMVENSDLYDACLLDEHGVAAPETPHSLQLEDLCPGLYGNTSTFCTDEDRGRPLTPSFVCNSLFCVDGPYCSHIIPPTGTCCGKGKQCIGGVCTETDTDGCDLDEDCPFQDHVNCNSSIIGQDFEECWNDISYSYCCRHCENRMDVAYPPTGPPIIRVNSILVDDHERTTVDLDEMSTVHCHVDGGLPEVTRVKMECEGLEYTENGNNNRFNFISSSEMDGTECVCSALHITGLYSLTSSFTVDIRVTPPSGAPDLTANGDPIANGDDVDIPFGDSLDVRCGVDGGFPDVSSVTIGCSGMRGTTQDGKYATKRIIASQEVDQAECVCSAQHASGQYNQTTSFSINVLQPPEIKKFSVDSKLDTSQDIRVIAGNTADFVCEAKGIPGPAVSIKRVSSGIHFQGTTNTSASDIYTKTFSKAKKIICTDAGHYRCIASNGVGDNAERDLSVVVDCPPVREHNSMPMSPVEISSSGQFQTSFQVISNPPVKRFRLVKYKRNIYIGRVTQMREYQPNEYLATVKYKDLVNSVTLDMFDSEPGENYFFTLELINGVEPALTVSFNSTFAPGVTRSRVEAVGETGSAFNLYLVTAVACVLLFTLIIGTVIFVNRFQKETLRHKKTKKSDQTNRNYMRGQMGSRMWMNNPGSYYY